MKKLLLSLALLLGSSVGALAQCVAISGVTSSPVPGITCASEPTVTSYMAAGFGIVPAASATDVVCLTGSATKVVRLQSMALSGTAGTLVNLPVRLMKHSVANTGGTAATSTALPVPIAVDSSFAAASATTTAYTANPTVDATAVALDAAILSLTATGTIAATHTAKFDYSGRGFAAAPTIRGVAQQLCVNFGGISVSSGLVAASIYWTEY